MIVKLPTHICVTRPYNELTDPTLNILFARTYIDGLARDCSISSALAMEILQPCAKPSIYGLGYKEMIGSDNALSPIQHFPLPFIISRSAWLNFLFHFPFHSRFHFRFRFHFRISLKRAWITFFSFIHQALILTPSDLLSSSTAINIIYTKTLSQSR